VEQDIGASAQQSGALGSTGTFFDVTPFGRQEEWEDSPEGYPQIPPYEWWNWHDDYNDAEPTQEWLDRIAGGRS